MPILPPTDRGKSVFAPSAALQRGVSGDSWAPAAPAPISPRSAPSAPVLVALSNRPSLARASTPAVAPFGKGGHTGSPWPSPSGEARADERADNRALGRRVFLHPALQALGAHQRAPALAQPGHGGLVPPAEHRVPPLHHP